MTRQFKPGVLDRLLAAGDAPSNGTAIWMLEQLKDSIARDLESLLNTRAHMSQASQKQYPLVARSVYNYGLMDFSSMCMNSEEDRDKICAEVKLAIERFECRLHSVTAKLRVHRTPVYRVDFVISAMIKASSAAEPVCFDAMVEPATQQYSVRRVSEQQQDNAA